MNLPKIFVFLDKYDKQILENNNITKRSVSVVADNLEIRNIKSVKIKSSNTITFKLLYDKNNLLTKKIKLEQKRKRKI